MKGATAEDKGAHLLMEFWSSRGNEVYDDSRYCATYHEERLYSVYDVEKDQVTLVYADSPQDAIRAVRGRGTVINVKQMGSNGTVIGHVDTLTL